MTPLETPRSGDILDGRYVVAEVLGRGGMGTVFVAEQINLGRKVAIKVLPTDMEERAEEYEHRFRREALAASRLQHPNIVQIVDYGRDERFGLYDKAREQIEAIRKQNEAYPGLSDWLRRLEDRKAGRPGPATAP